MPTSKSVLRLRRADRALLLIHSQLPAELSQKLRLAQFDSKFLMIHLDWCDIEELADVVARQAKLSYDRSRRKRLIESSLFLQDYVTRSKG